MGVGAAYRCWSSGLSVFRAVSVVGVGAVVSVVGVGVEGVVGVGY